MPTISRRALLLSAGALALVRPALAATPPIHVLKDPTCPCCTEWVAVLEADGFSVTVETVEDAALLQFKVESGIPEAAYSCHTAQIDGYILEGHVPPADVRRLVAERPEAVGLAVPGMPYGSPGMGPETEREAYDVVLIGKDGATSVYTAYPAA